MVRGRVALAPGEQVYGKTIIQKYGIHIVFGPKARIRNTSTDIKSKELPKTSGFFFGDDSSDDYVEQDLQFIEDARKAIAEGKKVAYSSWW